MMRFVSDSQRKAVFSRLSNLGNCSHPERMGSFFRLRNSFSRKTDDDFPIDAPYTFKQHRDDARRMVLEDFEKNHKDETVLNVVPIEKSHNKTEKIPNPDPNGPERFHYQKVAVLSSLKDTDSPSGVTYILRKGKALGGVGFVENLRDGTVMTSDTTEAYTKLNELDMYPKENKKKEPTMADWSGEFEDDE